MEAAYISSYLQQLVQRDIAPPQPAPQIHIPNPSRPFELSVARKDLGADARTSQHFELKVKSLKPAITLTIPATLSMSVEELKTQIASRASDFPPEAQRLVVGGKGLVDGRTLEDYALAAGATIHLLKKAGAPAAKAALNERSEAKIALGEKGPAFWDSLKAFLDEQFRDPADAEKVLDAFRSSYIELVKNGS